MGAFANEAFGVAINDESSSAVSKVPQRPGMILHFSRLAVYGVSKVYPNFRAEHRAITRDT